MRSLHTSECADAALRTGVSLRLHGLRYGAPIEIAGVAPVVKRREPSGLPFLTPRFRSWTMCVRPCWFVGEQDAMAAGENRSRETDRSGVGRPSKGDNRRLRAGL